MAAQHNYGTGRRKSSTARVFLRKGSGNIVINGRAIDEFFGRETSRMIVRQPLELTNHIESFDVSVTVEGGGITGQSVAARMAIARALLVIDQEYRGQLKEAGYLSRDPREKERKKPGLKRARKGPTYTKR